VTDREATHVESFTTTLSVAISLVDRRTGGPPVGEPTVTVTNADYDPVRTPSGYHVLVDLPAHPATIEVVVDAEAYIEEERPITHGSLPSDEPLVEIELEPGPAYPYGDGETVVRGVVEEHGEPVAGAAVAYVQGSATARTNEDGEYALPIREIDSVDVETDSDGNEILSPGGDTPTIEATHPDDGTTDVDVSIPLGGTASAHLAF
jgi:hypothetical protein